MTQQLTQPLTQHPARHPAGAGGPDRPGTSPCDPAARVTRSLLGYGVIAGPVYVLVSVVEGLTRAGFSLARHPWSLLSNGSLGWIHVTNLALAGLMTLALAAGARRALGPGARWLPRLLAGYGVGLAGAAVFRADPALGFPAGTPAGTTAVSWHGVLHFGSAGVGFGCLIAACFVFARSCAAAGRRGWAVYSRVTGALFAAGFVGTAVGGGRTWVNLAFVAAVVLAWAWVSALAVHLYRHVGRQPSA